MQGLRSGSRFFAQLRTAVGWPPVPPTDPTGRWGCVNFSGPAGPIAVFPSLQFYLLPRSRNEDKYRERRF